MSRSTKPGGKVDVVDDVDPLAVVDAGPARRCP
jgi:hypothetical protein